MLDMLEKIEQKFNFRYMLLKVLLLICMHFMMCRCDFFLKNDPSLFFLKLFFVNKLLPLLFNKSQQLVISKYSSAASLVV